jgi:micrococcal nuclease
VERIVDGDTLRVVIADRGSERIRLLNIDTPELARDGRPAECLAVEATDRLAALVAPGDLVWLAGDVQDRDRYDRLLRGLWTVDGVFVNEVLVAEGLAEVLLIAPNDRFHARIAEAEGAARADRRGLWGAACG